MMLRDPKGVADQFPRQLTDAFVIPVTYAICRAREFRLLSTHIDFRRVMLRRWHQTTHGTTKKACSQRN
jgi:hypothetical protein